MCSVYLCQIDDVHQKKRCARSIAAASELDQRLQLLKIGKTGDSIPARRQIELSRSLERISNLSSDSLKNSAMVAIAALAFIGIFFLAIPFPLIVLGAGVIGFAGHILGLPGFAVQGGHDNDVSAGADGSVIDAIFARGVPAHVRPSLKRALGLVAQFVGVAAGGG